MTDVKAMGSDSSRRGVVAFLQRLDIHGVLIIVAFGMFFAQAAQPHSYADLGWHLRTGQLIWETGSIPHSDPYSFTVNGQPWITHEWLSEVIMWPIYATWGLAGLIVICSSTILLGLWFVYRQMRTEGTGRLGATLMITLCAFTSMTVWSTLPLVATLCLAPFYAQRLQRWWQGDESALVPTAADDALGEPARWVHGGLGIGRDFSFGGLLSGWMEAEPSHGSLRSLAIVGGLCLLATLANPNTYEILWYPFDTLTSAAMRKYLFDWPSPNFHAARYWPFGLMLALSFAAAARNRRRIAINDLFLILVLAGMGLQSNRHVSLFALICTPILARQLGELGDECKRC